MFKLFGMTSDQIWQPTVYLTIGGLIQSEACIDAVIRWRRGYWRREVTAKLLAKFNFLEPEAWLAGGVLFGPPGGWNWDDGVDLIERELRLQGNPLLQATYLRAWIIKHGTRSG